MYMSLINTTTLRKNLDVTHINLPIEHTHHGQLNIFTSRFLFYSIVRNNSFKLQINCHEKQKIYFKGNIIATNLKCEIFSCTATYIFIKMRSLFCRYENKIRMLFLLIVCRQKIDRKSKNYCHIAFFSNSLDINRLIHLFLTFPIIFWQIFVASGGGYTLP